MFSEAWDVRGMSLFVVPLTKETELSAQLCIFLYNSLSMLLYTVKIKCFPNIVGAAVP